MGELYTGDVLFWVGCLGIISLWCYVKDNMIVDDSEDIKCTKEK